MNKALLLAGLSFILAVGCARLYGMHIYAIISQSNVTTFTDKRDGQKYRVVQIGKQRWMAENLNYAADGSKCYDNDTAKCAKLGRLYPWDAAIKVCPAGFHLPESAEWAALIDYAGDTLTAGKKLKSTSGWEDYGGESGNGTDDYGFSALPGGGQGYGENNLTTIGDYGYWWSATEDDGGYRALDWSMFYSSDYVHERPTPKVLLFSVRCVQDDVKDGGNE